MRFSCTSSTSSASPDDYLNCFFMILDSLGTSGGRTESFTKPWKAGSVGLKWNKLISL
jgi:hypothetical protein